jgi:CRP-like cAMP-binding protein
MTENSQLKSSLKEVKEVKEKETNINIQKMLKRGNTLIKKSFLTKRSLRHSLDITGLLRKKTFSIKYNNASTPVDLCLRALSNQPKQRDNECLNHITSYLKSLPNFMNIVSKEKNMKISENLIEQISIHLRHEFIPKNNLVCRYGEKGEKFYIILKGKVIFLIPKPIKCYLNLEEYVLYLMQLRKNNEFELINNLLVQNRIYFHIEDDDLDLYLMKEYEEYQNYLKKTGRRFNKSKTKILPNRLINNRLINLNSSIGKELMPTIRNTGMNINDDDDEDSKNKKKKQKKYFSPATYKKMEDLIEIIKNPKFIFEEDPFLGLYNPRYYIKSNNIPNTKLESKGRKLVTVFNYEEMSSFENGQTFGFVALQSKNSKRIATAIVVEDCDLGVLTKDEYFEFFEILSNKEKKNLYDLLKFYNLITTVSEYKFIKRYYHMFEYIKYYKNNIVMDNTKKINDLIVFNSGLFVVNICVNIPELNELMTKLRLIRGKLLGLSRYKIDKELDEKRENQDFIMRKNYISKEENKILQKKYNYTLSIISDHLIIGYPDTVDPVTHLPLFNCSCLSAESDAYLISNRAISLINEESIVIHNLKDYCLMKLEYNLNRLQQFKKEVLTKARKNLMVPPTNKRATEVGISGPPKDKERSFSEANINKNDIEIKKILKKMKKIIVWKEIK